MKSLLPLLILLSSVFLTTNGQAESVSAGKISNIYPASNGTVIINLVIPHTTNCNNNGSNPYYYIAAGQNSVTAQGLKTLYASALTAFAMSLPITIAYDETTNGCYVNRLVVSAAN